jgi:hypothetical protein
VTAPARASKTASTFGASCSVRATIRAKPEEVWALLTDAAGFPKWNSTVTRIDGEIAEGRTLALRVPAAPKRVFRPKVSRVVPARSMVWSEGTAPFFRGVRTFTLEPAADGSTHFTMTEALSGWMLPMIKGSLPDFAPIFETYAEDLKRAAEGTRAT